MRKSDTDIFLGFLSNVKKVEFFFRNLKVFALRMMTLTPSPRLLPGEMWDPHRLTLSIYLALILEVKLYFIFISKKNVLFYFLTFSFFFHFILNFSSFP